MSLRRHILVLVGPTASGKSKVALRLVTRIAGEIISADSRQVFKHLDIGTAKPSRDDLDSVPHHFVDELPPDRDFNAGDFGERGRQVIEEIFRRHRTPIVVGGSGLYVQALIDGLFEGPSADKGLRKVLEARLLEEGRDSLLAALKRVDPESAATIDPTKPRRIIRALEVFYVTGKTLAEQQRAGKVDPPFTSHQFGLDWPRAILYRRINERCDEMLRRGLLREVEELELMGFADSLNALNTVGYREAFAYRRGDISYDELVRLFKQNTRHYAKRQLTWFRRDARIEWRAVQDESGLDGAADLILERFKKAARQ